MVDGGALTAVAGAEEGGAETFVDGGALTGEAGADDGGAETLDEGGALAGVVLAEEGGALVGVAGTEDGGADFFVEGGAEELGEDGDTDVGGFVDGGADDGGELGDTVDTLLETVNTGDTGTTTGALYGETVLTELFLDGELHGAG